MWLASLPEENVEGDRPAQQDPIREQALAYGQAQLTDVAVARCEARCVGVACAVGVELITDAGATAST